MGQLWTLPTLLIMALGLVILNAGFCRKGFSLTAAYKSLVVLFLALIVHIVVFPYLQLLVGRTDSDHLMEVQSALFLGIAVLIVTGGGVERLNPKATVLGLLAWTMLVYLPFSFLARPEGYLMLEWGLKDFAGGLLVHATTGASALGLAIAKGRRLEFFNLKKSSNLGLFCVGAGLILVGWLGFNASGAQSMAQQASAVLNTLLSGSAGFVVWSALDRWHPPQRVSIKGGAFGMISGLVVITPGAGWLSVEMALIAVVAGTIAAFYCALFIEKALRYDDEMKVCASHFVPSWVGALFVAMHFSEFGFRSEILLPILTGAYCLVVTFFIFRALDKILGITLSEKQEMESPDLLLLGESSIEV